MVYIMAIVVAGVILLPRSKYEFFCAVALLAVALIAVCYLKGEAPGWRWGDRQDQTQKGNHLEPPSK
jgi:hypothetical protein